MPSTSWPTRSACTARYPPRGSNRRIYLPAGNCSSLRVSAAFHLVPERGGRVNTDAPGDTPQLGGHPHTGLRAYLGRVDPVPAARTAAGRPGLVRRCTTPVIHRG